MTSRKISVAVLVSIVIISIIQLVFIKNQLNYQNWIIVIASEDRGSDIYLIDPLNIDNYQSLNIAKFNPSSLSLSNDRKILVFSGFEDGNSGLYTVPLLCIKQSACEDQVIKFFSSADDIYQDPVWSLDDEEIYYVFNEREMLGVYSSYLEVYDIDSEEINRLDYEHVIDLFFINKVELGVTYLANDINDVYKINFGKETFDPIFLHDENDLILGPYALSEDERILYLTSGWVVDEGIYKLDILSKEFQLLIPVAAEILELSPNEKQIAYSIYYQKGLYIYNIERNDSALIFDYYISDIIWAP